MAVKDEDKVTIRSYTPLTVLTDRGAQPRQLFILCSDFKMAAFGVFIYLETCILSLWSICVAAFSEPHC